MLEPDEWTVLELIKEVLHVCLRYFFEVYLCLLCLLGTPICSSWFLIRNWADSVESNPSFGMYAWAMESSVWSNKICPASARNFERDQEAWEMVFEY